jgi:uncharacterized protein YraI
MSEGTHALDIVADGYQFNLNINEEGGEVSSQLFVRGEEEAVCAPAARIEGGYVEAFIPYDCMGHADRVDLIAFVYVTNGQTSYFDEHPGFPAHVTLEGRFGPALDRFGQPAAPAEEVPEEPEDVERVTQIGDPTLDPVVAAVELSRAQHEMAPRVLLGRGSVFADSLASGVLQNTRTPLLLTDEETLEPFVVAELERLGTQEVVILGGVDAVSPAVEDNVRGRGITTTRLSGPTRIETALAVARSLETTPREAIIVRAFAGAGDPTQAYADSMSVGPMAAVHGWPILLTPSEDLAEVVADYLSEAGIEVVHIIGGQAAVSDRVVEEINGLGIETRRIAGLERSSTAVAIAHELGSPELVMVTDGVSPTAWGSGLASTSMAVARGAAILLSTTTAVPESTANYLAGRASSHALCTPQLLGGCQAVASLLGTTVRPLADPAVGPLLKTGDAPVPVCWSDPSNLDSEQNVLVADCMPHGTVVSAVPGLPPSTATCRGQVPTIRGTDGPDWIRGTDGDDVVLAGSGNDVVYGGGGDDLICGGGGDDDLVFGVGANTILGEGGDDILRSIGDVPELTQLWERELAAGRGFDPVLGIPHHLEGGDGDDILIEGPGLAWLDGGRDDDLLIGHRYFSHLNVGDGTCENPEDNQCGPHPQLTFYAPSNGVDLCVYEVGALTTRPTDDCELYEGEHFNEAAYVDPDPALTTSAFDHDPTFSCPPHTERVENDCHLTHAPSDPHALFVAVIADGRPHIIEAALADLEGYLGGTEDERRTYVATSAAAARSIRAELADRFRPSQFTLPTTQYQQAAGYEECYIPSHMVNVQHDENIRLCAAPSTDGPYAFRLYNLGNLPVLIQSPQAEPIDSARGGDFLKDVGANVRSFMARTGENQVALPPGSYIQMRAGGPGDVLIDYESDELSTAVAIADVAGPFVIGKVVKVAKGARVARGIANSPLGNNPAYLAPGLIDNLAEGMVAAPDIAINAGEYVLCVGDNSGVTLGRVADCTEAVLESVDLRGALPPGISNAAKVLIIDDVIWAAGGIEQYLSGTNSGSFTFTYEEFDPGPIEETPDPGVPTNPPPGTGYVAPEATTNTPGDVLNVRGGPSTIFPVVRTVVSGTALNLVCWASGSSHSGTAGTTDRWAKIDTANQEWISMAWVGVNGDLPPCSTAPQSPIQGGSHNPQPPTGNPQEPYNPQTGAGSPQPPTHDPQSGNDIVSGRGPYGADGCYRLRVNQDCLHVNDHRGQIIRAGGGDVRSAWVDPTTGLLRHIPTGDCFAHRGGWANTVDGVGSIVFDRLWSRFGPPAC